MKYKKCDILNSCNVTDLLIGIHKYLIIMQFQLHLHLTNVNYWNHKLKQLHNNPEECVWLLDCNWEKSNYLLQDRSTAKLTRTSLGYQLGVFCVTFSVSLGKSKIGIWKHRCGISLLNRLIHGAFKEPKNPCPEWIQSWNFPEKHRHPTLQVDSGIS